MKVIFKVVDNSIAQNSNQVLINRKTKTKKNQTNDKRVQKLNSTKFSLYQNISRQKHQYLICSAWLHFTKKMQ